MRISDWSSDVCSSDLRAGVDRAFIAAFTPEKVAGEGDGAGDGSELPCLGQRPEAGANAVAERRDAIDAFVVEAALGIATIYGALIDKPFTGLTGGAEQDLEIEKATPAAGADSAA